MDELAYLMDWDLAIVKGCSSEAPATIMDSPHLNFSYFSSGQDNLLLSFPEISETMSVLDELEELYKPFYPVLHPLSTQTIVTTSEPIPREVKASEHVQELKDPEVSEFKRSKKKQNKRVVKEVTADELSDTWAWRKYGQKPIKGSPYPRSYYRCSSFKGCSARKQVERSHLNPGVFIITYTAEHSHAHPTRRNSLAGTTRNRKNKLITSTPEFSETIEETCSSNSTALVSPRTSVVGSIEYELVPSVQSEGLEKEDQLELLDDAQGQGTETVMGVEEGDDWFASIEELNGLYQQLA